MPIRVELSTEGVWVYEGELLQHMLLKAKSKLGRP